MANKLKLLWAWLTDRNWKTWIGHGLWGVGFEWTLGWLHWSYALVSVVVTFAFREVDNALQHAVEDEPRYKSFGRALWRTIRDDGAMDFFSPMLGWVIGLWIKQVLGIHVTLFEVSP